MSSLGKRIREIRTENCLTQRQFGEQIGIHKIYVCQVEKGDKNPSESLVRLIALKFFVNLNWLKTGTGPREPEIESELKEIIARTLEAYAYDVMICMAGHVEGNKKGVSETSGNS